MTEPTRLIDSGATEFERYLLGAATRERPTRLQHLRMRRSIVLAELGILGTVVKALAAATQQIVMVSVVAGALAGQGSVPTSTWLRESREPVANITEHPSKSLSSEGKSTNETAIPRLEVTDELPEVTQSRLPHSKTEVTKVPSLAPRRTIELREEIALMDLARAALRSGSPKSALEYLEQYRSRFPSGSFGQEAQALRIEAIAASGNIARARSLAKAFLARSPNSPHSARLQRLVDSSPSELR
jgi:TolA-binding protein